MRRYFVLSAIVSLALIAGFIVQVRARPAATPAAVKGPGDVYVALGDSLAAGFITSRPEDAYVARIAAAIRQAQPIEVRNFAVPGETSVSLLRSQLPQALAFIRQQQEQGRRVSPITLDIGGNDANGAVAASSVERQRTIDAIEANVAAALDQLIAATTSPDGQRTADIAIMTYYNPYPGDVTDERAPAYWSSALNAALARVANERGVAVADVEGAFAGGNVYRYTYIASGDIHANSDGHALIADHFLDALGYTHLSQP